MNSSEIKSYIKRLPEKQLEQVVIYVSLFRGLLEIGGDYARMALAVVGSEESEKPI